MGFVYEIFKIQRALIYETKPIFDVKYKDL